MTPTAVMGAGAWGTALAWLLAKKGEHVRLWAYEPEVAAQVNEARENSRYLPGIALPPTLKASASVTEVLEGVGALIFVVPSHVAAGVIAQIAPHLPPGIPIVNVQGSGLQPSARKPEASSHPTVPFAVFPRRVSRPRSPPGTAGGLRAFRVR